MSRRVVNKAAVTRRVLTIRAVRARAAVRARGLTLVEVLVTLAIVAALASGTVSAVRGAGLVSGRIAANTDAAQKRVLAGSLLRAELERAGRGGPDAGARLALLLDRSGGGGDALEIGYVAAEGRAEPTMLRATFFAARDGRGRPNLYRRPPGAVRQPWLLGVTGVHVVGGRDRYGRPIGRSDLTPGREVAALELEVRFADADPVRVWASTRGAGPLTAPAWGAAP